MPQGRKKAEHRRQEETAAHGASSSPEPDALLAGASSPLTPAHPSPDQQHSPMDLYAFLTYMKERDDAARVEREEEAARYRAELAEQKREDAARFEALLSKLAPQPASSPAFTPGHPPPVSSHTPQVPVSSSPVGTPSAPKAAAQPPPVLSTDVTFQYFREWRRRWADYATMVDLASLPQPKQLIQLRMCLSLETQRVLEHTLLVPPDSTSSVDEVLNTLQQHFKDSSNEALRRRAFTSCKQAPGETFADFFVRLKGLSEEIDVCKANDNDCQEAWIKHGILTGVSDEELVQKIVALDASSTLSDVVTLCRAHEATRSAATALRAPPAARAVSQYKKGKKATHKSKAESQRVAPTSSSPCSDCGKQQHGPKGCPSATATCIGCGKTGHWSHTEKCPARNVQCNACNRYGHFEKFCKSSMPKKSQRPAKPKNPKPAGDNRSTFHVVRAQTPHHVPRALEDQAGSIRRVQSSARGRPTPSPTITVVVTRGGVSGSIEVIPDTGADTTVIGPQHLRDLGLTKQELDPPPSLRYYNADGSRMPAALGSFQAKLTYGTLSCTGWIDVQGSLSTPLLSWEHCRSLAIVPSNFPMQIKTSRTTVNRVGESPDVQPVEASRGGEHPDATAALLSAAAPLLPLLSTTTPQAAKEYFLREYSDVLVRKADLQDAPLKPMSGPPMRIHLKEDAQPFAIHTPRPIPLAYQDPVKAELDSMVSQGIIAPVGDDPSPWCHPMVVVPKASGGVRITTDLSKLNGQVSCPTHPSPTPFAAIRSVHPGAQFFTTVDALCGYWQLQLAAEDQSLTTFITPYGRFRYLRGPMGFAATGDAFCRRGDIALQGVPQCVKVVDDILLYDEDYLTHLQRVNEVLSRCRTHGITLNADKFVLASQDVSFCGYQLSTKGIAADPEKVRAIRDFAKPANLTDLRSFMGLVNQLTEFSPDISSAAAPLRPLMSPRKAFLWTPDHDLAFQRVKEALSSPPVLATFDPALPTILQTDASRLYGLGYALLQDHGGGKLHLVQCGSRFLTDAETRYATIELELLAAVWAMFKCKFYVLGLQHFDLVMDHRPLVPILNSYSLDAIDNPRLQRLKEKISAFVFTATWRPGKKLCIPDALSRSPVSKPTQEDNILDAETNFSVRSVVTLHAIESLASEDIQASPDQAVTRDLTLEGLRRAALDDPAYSDLLRFVKEGFPSDRYALPNVLRPYWKLREDLYCDDALILYGARIVVPASLRRHVLGRLHDSHRGAEATKRRARQVVYWPGMNSDIVNTVRACEPCQILQPSQQREPLRCDDNPSRPFESVSADFFMTAGKNFLVVVDRLSGWPVVVSCGADTTSSATIRHFRQLFRDLGVPVRLRTDGGPQFASREFAEFLERWGVRHDMSTPYNPQSNGHAESAVKAVKHLIQKVAPTGNLDCEAFDRGLLELRNTPNYTGRSPAQTLYGRPLRSCVPAHAKAFQKEWQARAESCDRRAAARRHDATARYDAHAKPLVPLNLDTQVRLQDPTTKRWDTVGIVMGVGQSRDYLVKMPSGRVLWRNRRLLRPVPPCPDDPLADAGPPVDPDLSTTPQPRRSDRLRAKNDQKTAQDTSCYEREGEREM